MYLTPSSQSQSFMFSLFQTISMKLMFEWSFVQTLCLLWHHHSDRRVCMCVRVCATGVSTCESRGAGQTGRRRSSGFSWGIPEAQISHFSHPLLPFSSLLHSFPSASGERSLSISKRTNPGKTQHRLVNTWHPFSHRFPLSQHEICCRLKKPLAGHFSSLCVTLSAVPVNTAGN